MKLSNREDDEAGHYTIQYCTPYVKKISNPRSCRPPLFVGIISFLLGEPSNMQPNNNPEVESKSPNPAQVWAKVPNWVVL